MSHLAAHARGDDRWVRARTQRWTHWLLCALVILDASVVFADAPVVMPEQRVVGRAQRSTKIVMLTMGERFGEQSWPELERRTAAELRAADLEVVTIPAMAADTDTRLAELGSSAATHGAFASIRIVSRDGRRAVQVWIYDALTRKMLLRQTPVTTSGPGAAAATALDVVELLHASLIEVRMRGRRGPPPEVAAPLRRIVEQRLAPPPARRKLVVSAAPALLSVPGGVGTVGGINLAVGVAPWPFLTLGLEALLPIIGTTTGDGEISAEILPFLFRAAALYEPWPHARVSPAIGVGLGALVTRGRGRAAPPLVNQTEWGAATLTTLRLQLALALTPNLRLAANANASAALPEITISMLGNAISSVGVLVIDASLGLSWSWGLR